MPVPFPAPLVALATALGTAATPIEEAFEFPAHGLTIRLPEVDDFEFSDEPDGIVRAEWNAELGRFRLGLNLIVFPDGTFGLDEPGDVTEELVDQLRQNDSSVAIDAAWFQEGEFGYAPFCSVVGYDLRSENSTQPIGRSYVLGGLLPDTGYALHLVCRPEPDEATDAILREFLEQGVSYAGPERDPEWTVDEIRARWIRDVPEDMHDKFVKSLKRPGTLKKFVVRTDNYIILSLGSGGKLFAKKLEENYKKIHKAFPFEEVEGRRLMPIFLFGTKGDYAEFYAHIAKTSVEQARRSKGHAWRDYYATYYDSPNDPVHIHEQTHQIFKSRLRLNGGGSWFQEGVAKYIESPKNELNIVTRLVRDGDATSLRELVQLRSLLYSSEDDVRGGSKAADNYQVSALLIEFLAKGKWGKGKFEEFLYTLGKVPRGDLEQIEAGFRRVYGVGLDEVEEAWRAYCKKR